MLTKTSHTLWFLSILASGCAAFEAPSPGNDGGVGGSGGTTTSGLPCDVAGVLDAHCVSCHGSPPTANAPMSLLSYADLTAPSAIDAQMTIAERCSVRMKDPQRPMPPGSGVTVSAAELASFDAWIQAGMPQGSCTTTDPFGGPPVCSSNRYWSGESSAEMDPGMPCVSCHARSGAEGEAPRFTLAGTVFPTGHEPDRCIASASAGATVRITDARGTVISLGANNSGNFSYQGGLATPYTAVVIFQGRERPMTAAQTSGDCNVCHSQNGANNAPGRIVLP